MSKRIALIVATYEYQDSGLRELVAPAQDAEALARVLKDPEIGGFDVQEVENRPSYEVNRQIESFFVDRKLKRDDLLLFYFSGHGIKDEEGRLYFATPDTHRDQLRSTAITATFIHDVMRHSRSRRQVLILDCCYSGAFPRGMVTRADEAIGTKERFEGLGRVVLTASDSMQYAFEGDVVDGKGVRSIFTSVLVHGLETGEADLDKDGNISLDELYDYVHNRVIDETPQQVPGKWAFDVQGEIIVARNPYPVVKPAELPPDLRRAIEDPSHWTRSGAVSGLERLLHGTDEGLALAAEEALQRLLDDDSRTVSAAAARALGVSPQPATPTPSPVLAPPVIEPVEPEKVTRAFQKLTSLLARYQPWSSMAGAVLAALALIAIVYSLTGGDGGTGLSPMDRTATAVAAIPISSDTPQPTATPELTDTVTLRPTATRTPTSIATARATTPTATTGVYLTDASVSFIVTLKNDPPKEIFPGGVLAVMPADRVLIEMSVIADQSPFPRNLTYRYFALKGSIPKAFAGPRLSYVAPDGPGSDFITVIITDTNTSDAVVRYINVEVEEILP